MAGGVVGLDIGSFAVRAVELTLGGGQVTLQRFGQVSLPPGAVRNGEVQDVGAVSAAIRRLWAEGGFRTKRVVTGVANQRVIVRQAELPAMTEADLRSALRFEAQELIPIPVEDAVLDFQVLEESISSDAEPRMRILLAAAQRDMIRTQLAAVEGAGLSVQAVDVIPFALVRALASTPAFDAEPAAEAIICIGGGVTNVVVHENGVPRFVRILLVGGDDITDAIATQLDVDVDSAEDLKRRADPGSGEVTVARAAQIMSDRLAPLVEEIRGSLDYYMAQAQSAPLSRIYVTGGGSRMSGLMERLQTQLGARVEPARPLSAVRQGTGIQLSPAQLADLEPLLTVPVGLALAGEQVKGVRRISLLPSEVAVGREERRQTVAAVAGIGALAAVLLVLWAARAGQVQDEQDSAEQAEQEVSRLQAEEARLRSTATIRTELQARQAQVQAVLSDDINWTRLFNEIATVIPNDVWLTSFSGQKAQGTVNINATGFDQTSTARWLLRAGELQSLTGLWVPNSTRSGTGADSLVTFTSTATLTPQARSDRAQRYLSEAQ